MARKTTRERKCIMIDYRLLQRVQVAASRTGESESEIINQMMWAGVLNGRCPAEKREISENLDEFIDFFKSFIDKHL